MTSTTNPPTALTPFPDHTQLPESDLTAQLRRRVGEASRREAACR